MDTITLGTRWRTLAPYLLSTLRIVTAFLFMQFGTAKWFAFPGADYAGREYRAACVGGRPGRRC
jgi:putative oxidoreductase